MKRFIIMAQQVGAPAETEVCQCDSNPEPIVEVLFKKTTSGRRHLPIYQSVRIVDRQAEA